mgnify:FL=1
MKKVLLIFTFAAVSFASCQSLDLESTYQVGSSNVWNKATLARQAVNGVYNELYVRASASDSENNWKVMNEAYSSVMDTDKNWYHNQKVCYGDGTPSSSVFSNMYKYYYTFIFRANDIISHIDKVPDMTAEEKGKLKAEAKFFRAFGYFNLNVLYRGVPLYLEYIENATNATRPRSSEQDVWNAVIQDLTDCVEEKNLPDRYTAGSSDYGRVSRAVALAYRGQAYQFLAARGEGDKAQYWQLALDDFEALEPMGFALYKGAGDDSFKQLLKPANEQCDEMIFSIRMTQKDGMGNNRAVLFGNRCTGVTSGAWNNYLPNPAFVESFENADGSKFNWEDYCPGWNDMTPEQRSVFFLRNEMSTGEIANMTAYGADMSKYEPHKNENRIKAAYDNRDPRLKMSVITPYSEYYGGIAGVPCTFTLRWPYRSDGASSRDIRTDTNSMFYYLWRKYVPEGIENTIRWVYEEDLILCRYAEILLRRAECLNELNRTDEAVEMVNAVRSRAKHILLNTNEFTQVKGQEDMRERIRNEFYWELAGEDSMYYNELRWGTWLDKKFRDHSSGQNGEMNTNGLMQIWGTKTYTWYSLGDYVQTWPIPAKEREMNPSLVQNEGWRD